MASDPEIALKKERLHWGIIAPAIILGVFLVALSLPLVLILKFATNLMAQLSPKGSGLNSTLMFWVFLPEFLLFAVTLLVTVAAYFTSEITLTNRRLVFRTGFLSRQSGELPLENVESIFILEPFFGRIFGYGTITVTSAGGNAFPLQYIRSPNRFHVLLQDAVNAAKTLTPTAPKHLPAIQDDSRYMPKASSAGQRNPFAA